MSSPFSQQAITAAIQQSLTQQVLPPDKRGALIVMATTDGVKAVFAAKVGEHWQFDGEADWHGGAVSVGASVMASW